jgi:alpha-N-arabinofuranosidase
MKKILLLFIVSFPFVLFAQNATIRINAERAIGEIDSNIYGVFMEPIGRNHSTTNIVVGPLYNLSSPTANKDGFNTIIIDAMKELKITNMRWPGGNYISSYNWQDGIGPKDQRPVRKDLAWGGFDANQVGTDEWVALNRAIGSENVICVNLGLGDINGARFWVEYCNIPSGTY